MGGRVHPGQVAGASQGHTETRNHAHSLVGTIESQMNLKCMFLYGGKKPEYPERTHAYTARKKLPQPGITNQEPSRCEANKDH